MLLRSTAYYPFVFCCIVMEFYLVGGVDIYFKNIVLHINKDVNVMLQKTMSK